MPVIQPYFYDVPCFLEVSEKRGMRYAVFSDPFEAMSFAAGRARDYGLRYPLCVNRRPWDEGVFQRTWIADRRRYP